MCRPAWADAWTNAWADAWADVGTRVGFEEPVEPLHQRIQMARDGGRGCAQIGVITAQTIEIELQAAGMGFALALGAAGERRLEIAKRLLQPVGGGLEPAHPSPIFVHRAKPCIRMPRGIVVKIISDRRILGDRDIHHHARHPIIPSDHRHRISRPSTHRGSEA